MCTTRLPLRPAALFLAGILAANASADDPSAGSTPDALKPGAPAGAYALSGFENINYYNGSLNLSLPLHLVEGRGKASMTVTLAIEQHWSVKSTSQGDPVPGTEWWSDWLPGYGPGMLLGRMVADGNVCGNGTFSQTSVTRFTFIAADRTEYDLRDVLTDGQPIFISCSTNIPERGTDFATADGSAATFRSDTSIHDGTVNQQGSTASVVRPSGYLMLRDGTRYRIDEGRVSWLRDRNGNRLSFDYEPQALKPRVTQITDSLNRRVTFQYLSDRDLITFGGFGGAQRTITVWRTSLGNVFPANSGYAVRQLQQLFPGLTFSPTLYNPLVVSQVDLPNGQSYRFFYNEYGEVEDIYLPTGGRFHYTYQAGLADGDGGETGWFLGNVRFAIYRRLKERTVYGNSGPELMTRISRPETKASTLGYVDVDQRSVPDALIRRERHYFFGRAAASLDLVPTAYNPWTSGKEYRTEVRSAADALVRRVERTWAQRAPVAWWTGLPEAAPPKDPRITETRTQLDDGTFSWQTFAYDTYNNRTRVSEFAYGALPTAPPVRRTDTSYITFNGAVNYATDFSIHIRDLPLQEMVFQGNGTPTPDERSRTTYEYDVYDGSPGHAPLKARANISGLDPAFASPALTTRGNLTATTRWLDTPSGLVTTYQSYDVAGNVVRTVNARGYETNYDFVDRFGTPDGEAQGNTPPSQLGGQTSFAFATSAVNAKGHQTYAQFDYSLGRPVDREDANNTVDSVFYADSLDRPTKVLRGQSSATRFAYNDMPPNPRVHSYSDRDTLNDGLIHTDAYFDALGRETSKLVFEAAGTEADFIVAEGRTYDGLGRVTTRFNPFRVSDTGPRYGHSTIYDELDRIVAVVGPDGATSTTSYTGAVTTTTDPAGKARRSSTDALGRVTAVVEDPGGLNATTTYIYDAFDDVTRVVQGSQERTFAYDSLRRPICASTPEARVGGTACTGSPLPTTNLSRYFYDANGNLTGRTDARGVTAIAGYDELDRVASRAYSDSTPVVTYTYDQALKGKGRFSSFSSTIAGETWGSAVDAYDTLGRITKSRQTAAGADYRFEYTYDLAGNLTTEKYPSGRLVTTTYDFAGRPRAVSEGAYAYAAVPTDGDYSAHGAVLNLKLGITAAGVDRWLQARFNCHLQRRFSGLGTSASAGDVLGVINEYGTDNGSDTNPCRPVPGDPGNNGNLLRQKILVNSTSVVRLTEAYTYDGANRLASATETQGVGSQVWTQAYGYDAWGNRAVLGGSYIPQPALTPTATNQFSAASNRIAVSPWAYDNAGNLTRDGLGKPFTYDAENRQISAGTTGSTDYTSYTYDGEGRRVRKTVGGTPTLYVYDAFGRLAAEYGSVNAPVATSFLVPDHLGSTRLTLDELGQVATRHDYLPFGEELPATAAFLRADYNGADQSVRHRFTGKERDLESGLDFFQARYNSGALGRFSAVDPTVDVKASIPDPQRWNRYAYTRNSPLKYLDPDGRAITYANRQLQTFFNFLSARNDDVRATLALYAGPDHPDLNISQANLGTDADGRLGGLFTPHFDFTTDAPPGSGNFDRLAGMSPAEIQGGIANGSLLTSATLRSATLQLDTSLNLSMSSLGKSKEEQRTIGVALHELGHADLAARRPLEFYRLAAPENQMRDGRRQAHDDREIEQQANRRRDTGLRDFPH